MSVLTANYHTHTYRCGHARGADRDYVENAVSGGIKVLGFSDHSPMIFRTDHYSGFRMPLADVPGYFESLLMLREEYRGRLTLYIGVETEYYPDTFADYLAFMAQFPLDYKILAQHFLWREEDGITAFSRTQDPARLQSYYENVLAAVATGEFLYIAHPDVLNYAGPDDAYETLTAENGHRTLCLYSTGNAISNQRQELMDSEPTGHTEDGIISGVTFEKWSDGTVRIGGIDITATWVERKWVGGRLAYRIYPLDPEADWSVYEMENPTKARRSYARTLALVGEGVNGYRAELGLPAYPLTVE